MGCPRILLADDHHEMLKKITETLESEFEIVAAVANGKQLIEAALHLDPDLIVLDISMPIVNGITAACHLRKSASRAKVVFLTMHEDPVFVAAAVSAGLLGMFSSAGFRFISFRLSARFCKGMRLRHRL
jgi:DNA-binding NarL/FixJ family response regulator